MWRICRRPFADLTGEGARLYGGRWNSAGRPVVYTADCAALSVLEVRVNLDLAWDVVPDDYVLMGIDVPDGAVEEAAAMPGDAKAAGDAWLASGRSALLKVASFIVPESANILINAAHPGAARIKIGPMRSFTFDERLWRPR